MHRALAAILLSTMLGCGANSARIPVYGSVSGPDAQPISGSVSFTPDVGHAGPGAAASLEAGKYKFDRSNGPQPGPHQVIIARRVSKQDLDQARAGKQNRKSMWTFNANVSAEGSHQFDFQLD